MPRVLNVNLTSDASYQDLVHDINTVLLGICPWFRALINSIDLWRSTLLKLRCRAQTLVNQNYLVHMCIESYESQEVGDRDAARRFTHHNPSCK